MLPKKKCHLWLCFITQLITLGTGSIIPDYDAAANIENIKKTKWNVGPPSHTNGRMEGWTDYSNAKGVNTGLPSWGGNPDRVKIKAKDWFTNNPWGGGAKVESTEVIQKKVVHVQFHSTDDGGVDVKNKKLADSGGTGDGGGRVIEINSTPKSNEGRNQSEGISLPQVFQSHGYYPVYAAANNVHISEVNDSESKGVQGGRGMGSGQHHPGGSEIADEEPEVLLSDLIKAQGGVIVTESPHHAQGGRGMGSGSHHAATDNSGNDEEPEVLLSDLIKAQGGMVVTASPQHAQGGRGMGSGSHHAPENSGYDEEPEVLLSDLIKAQGGTVDVHPKGRTMSRSSNSDLPSSTHSPIVLTTHEPRIGDNDTTLVMNETTNFNATVSPEVIQLVANATHQGNKSHVTHTDVKKGRSVSVTHGKNHTKIIVTKEIVTTVLEVEDDTTTASPTESPVKKAPKTSPASSPHVILPTTPRSTEKHHSTLPPTQGRSSPAPPIGRSFAKDSPEKSPTVPPASGRSFNVDVSTHQPEHDKHHNGTTLSPQGRSFALEGTSPHPHHVVSASTESSSSVHGRSMPKNAMQDTTSGPHNHFEYSTEPPQQGRSFLSETTPVSHPTAKPLEPSTSPPQHGRSFAMKTTGIPKPGVHSTEPPQHGRSFISETSPPPQSHHFEYSTAPPQEGRSFLEETTPLSQRQPKPLEQTTEIPCEETTAGPKQGDHSTEPPQHGRSFMSETSPPPHPYRFEYSTAPQQEGRSFLEETSPQPQKGMEHSTVASATSSAPHGRSFSVDRHHTSTSVPNKAAHEDTTPPTLQGRGFHFEYSTEASHHPPSFEYSTEPPAQGRSFVSETTPQPHDNASKGIMPVSNQVSTAAPGQLPVHSTHVPAQLHVTPKTHLPSETFEVSLTGSTTVLNGSAGRGGGGGNATGESRLGQLPVHSTHVPAQLHVTPKTHLPSETFEVSLTGSTTVLNGSAGGGGGGNATGESLLTSSHSSSNSSKEGGTGTGTSKAGSFSTQETSSATHGGAQHGRGFGRITTTKSDLDMYAFGNHTDGDLSAFQDCSQGDCSTICGGTKLAKCDVHNGKICLCPTHKFVSIEMVAVIHNVTVPNMEIAAEATCSASCSARSSYARILHRSEGKKDCLCLTHQMSSSGITYCDPAANVCQDICQSDTAKCAFNGICLCQNSVWEAFYNLSMTNVRKEDSSDKKECGERCSAYNYDFVTRIYDSRMGNLSLNSSSVSTFGSKYCICGPQVSIMTNVQTKQMVSEGFLLCTGLRCKTYCGMRDAVCEAKNRRACLCPRQNIFIGSHLWSRLPSHSEVHCQDTCFANGLQARVIEKNPLLVPDSERYLPWYRHSMYEYGLEGKVCHCIKMEFEMGQFKPCTNEICRWVCGHAGAECDTSSRRACVCNNQKLLGGLGRQTDPGEVNCDIACRHMRMDAMIMDVVWDITNMDGWGVKKSKYCGCIRPTTLAGLTNCEGGIHDKCPIYCNNPQAYCTLDKYCECGVANKDLAVASSASGPIRLPTGEEMEECGEKCRSWLWPIAEDHDNRAFIYDEGRLNCSGTDPCPKVDTSPWKPKPYRYEFERLNATIHGKFARDLPRKFCLCGKTVTHFYKPGTRFSPLLIAPKAPVELECIGSHTCVVIDNIMHIQ